MRKKTCPEGINALHSRQKNPIIFLKKILKKLLTRSQVHAIIISPGSERLKGEPGPVGRDKPVEKKGASLDWKPETSKKTGQLKGTIAER